MIIDKEERGADKLSLWLMLGLIFLLPIFFLPSLSTPLILAKTILLSILSAVILIIFLVGLLREGRVVIPKNILLSLVVLIPLSYLLSSWKSVSKPLSFFGYNLELGTFASILLLFVVLVLATLVFRKKINIFKAYVAIFCSFFLIAPFGVIKILSHGNLLVLNNFTGVVGNPVGGWTDYAMFFGLFALLSTVALERFFVRGRMRVALYASFILSLIFVILINFSITWVLILIGSLIIFGTHFTSGSLGENFLGGKKLWKTSKYSIILIILSIIFIIDPTVSATTGTLGNTISSMVGIQNVEVRPSLGATFDITKPVLKTNPILGSGPNTFAREWLMYKPAVINATNFWNVQFPFGVGFLPTQIPSVGLLGGLLWLVFILGIIYLAYKALFKKFPEDPSDKFLVLSSTIATLFLWGGAILYVPSIVMIALAFVFTGIFIAILTSTGVIQSKTITWTNSPKKNLFAILLVVLLVAGSLSFGFKSFQKTLAASYFQSALVSANSGSQDIDALSEKISKAATFSPEDIYYRALSTLAFNKAQKIANSTPNPTTEVAESFKQALSQSITYAQQAINSNPGSYENWVTLGGIYEALVPAPLAVAGAYENAKAAYMEAQKRNPNSSEMPLILARLELSNKNVEAARSYVAESLKIKNDYADAYFFLTRLEIQNNNLSEAIKSAEAAAQLSQGNAGVYFELGLLKYTAKDYNGAGAAFVEALKVVPNYANAQYFLGLSLYELKRTDEAIRVFEELEKSNPDNAEVKSILANLRAGNSPFFPSKNTSAASPASRSTPPIEDKKASQ